MSIIAIPVPGYESLYTVDEAGNVYSCRAQRYLTHSISGNGYHTVEFNENGKNKRVLVHRLVASVFIENPLGLPQVNHKDENKDNNNVSNLEWCTAKYNMSYGSGPNRRVQSRLWYTRTDRIKDIARRNGSARKKAVLQIDRDSGNVIAEFESAKEASIKTSVDHAHLCACCTGKGYKTAGGFVWRYKERV